MYYLLLKCQTFGSGTFFLLYLFTVSKKYKNIKI